MPCFGPHIGVWSLCLVTAYVHTYATTALSLISLALLSDSYLCLCLCLTLELLSLCLCVSVSLISLVSCVFVAVSFFVSRSVGLSRQVRGAVQGVPPEAGQRGPQPRPRRGGHDLGGVPVARSHQRRVPTDGEPM